MKRAMIKVLVHGDMLIGEFHSVKNASRRGDDNTQVTVGKIGNV